TVESHLQACGECRAALATADRLARALESAPVPDPGTNYWAKFAARVEARTQRAASREPARGYERLLGWLVPSRRGGWVGTLGPVAAVTLVVYVGLRGFRPHDTRVATSSPPSEPSRADTANKKSIEIAPALPRSLEGDASGGASPGAASPGATSPVATKNEAL